MEIANLTDILNKEIQLTIDKIILTASGGVAVSEIVWYLDQPICVIGIDGPRIGVQQFIVETLDGRILTIDEESLERNHNRKK